MNQRTEICAAPELLERILKLVGTDMILIGGQALAFWAAYYGIPAPAVAVTKDVDLLGTRDDVRRLALGLNGKAEFPIKNLITLLAGQVTKDLPDGNYISIDVLLGVYGDITIKSISNRAVLAENAAGRFRVMHPLDVLQGRLENVYGLTEKQDEHGIAQLRLAIEMARAFLRDTATRETTISTQRSRPIALSHVARIEKMALSDAGRKVVKRHHVYVADAIDPAPVSHIKPFVSRKLPQLLKLMSAPCRSRIKQDEWYLVAQSALALNGSPNVALPGNSEDDDDGKLAKAEREALRSVGALKDTDKPVSPGNDPLLKTQVQYMALMEESFSVQQAAKLLKIDVSRVRQRLRERSLFGIEHEGSWRLPRFQFKRHLAIPGLARVLKALPEDLFPLDIVDWFLLPNVDLELEKDAKPLSPRAWLMAGRPVDAVEILASARVGV